MEAKRVRDSAEFQCERVSGVHTRLRPDGPSAEEAALELSEIAGAPVTVLLLPSCGQPARASSSDADGDDLGFPLALRLHAWLFGVEERTRLQVPAYVRRWLGEDSVAAFPMKAFRVDPVGVRTVGVAIVGASTLSHERFLALEAATVELALRVDDADAAHAARTGPRLFAVK